VIGNRKSGIFPKEAADLSIRDLLSKMSTGKETFRTDLPEKMLAPICLITNIRVSF
jgi:hypothetical protein